MIILWALSLPGEFNACAVSKETLQQTAQAFLCVLAHALVILRVPAALGLLGGVWSILAPAVSRGWTQQQMLGLQNRARP